MDGKLVGRLVKVGAAQNVGKQKDFWKRTFWIDTAEAGSKYPNVVELELTQEKCPLIDGFGNGDTVSVEFFVNGRVWKNPKDGVERCFNSLRAVSVTAGEASGAFAEAEGEADAAEGGDDDMPF